MGECSNGPDVVLDVTVTQQCCVVHRRAYCASNQPAGALVTSAGTLLSHRDQQAGQRHTRLFCLWVTNRIVLLVVYVVVLVGAAVIVGDAEGDVGLVGC